MIMLSHGEMVMKLKKMLVDHAGLNEMGITYSRMQLWRMMQRGDFPHSVKLSRRKNAKAYWVYEEVVEWIEDQIRIHRSYGPTS